MPRILLYTIACATIWFGQSAIVFAQQVSIDWTTLDRLHAPLLTQDLRIRGAASCAAASCHGGPRPGIAQPSVTRGSEYQLWKERDPHANSWTTISSQPSVDIMSRLGIMVEGKIVNQAGFDNCLACHNTTRRFNEPRSQVQHREGVGCASCHGPSERWAGTHFQHSFVPELATTDGFVNVGDLYTRARVCASCHVGDQDRDMNHDIIAAGHPELKYELANYHARQPKHWRDAESRDAGFYEAQLWLAGQVAATDASLSLLTARAAGKHTVSQWPEFAAYDCSSCHHSLGLKRRPNQTASTARYSQWNDAGLRWLIQHRQANGQATGEDWALIDALDEVQQAMQSQAVPDRQRVSQAAQTARRALTAWFDGAAGTSERACFRSDRLGLVVAGAAGKQTTFTNWESSVQFYLAAVAARASWPGGWDGPLRDVSEPLRTGLRYPESLNINRPSSIPGQPTMTAPEAMRLGVQLAGWLGPIAFQEMDDGQDHSEQLRRQLRQMIEQINQRWDKIQLENAAQPRPDQPPEQPRRKPKTPEELLEQLRQRNKGDQSD